MERESRLSWSLWQENIPYLKKVAAAQKPGDKGLADLQKILIEHYAPKLNIIVENQQQLGLICLSTLQCWGQKKRKRYHGVDLAAGWRAGVGPSPRS